MCLTWNENVDLLEMELLALKDLKIDHNGTKIKRALVLFFNIFVNHFEQAPWFLQPETTETLRSRYLLFQRFFHFERLLKFISITPPTTF